MRIRVVPVLPQPAHQPIAPFNPALRIHVAVRRSNRPPLLKMPKSPAQATVVVLLIHMSKSVRLRNLRLLRTRVWKRKPFPVVFPHSQTFTVYVPISREHHRRLTAVKNLSTSCIGPCFSEERIRLNLRAWACSSASCRCLTYSEKLPCLSLHQTLRKYRLLMPKFRVATFGHSSPCLLCPWLPCCLSAFSRSQDNMG